MFLLCSAGFIEEIYKSTDHQDVARREVGLKRILTSALARATSNLEQERADFARDYSYMFSILVLSLGQINQRLSVLCGVGVLKLSPF